MFLWISQKSQENTCARVSSLIKLQARPAALLKKSVWHRCFPVNFVKFLRTTFLFLANIKINIIFHIFQFSFTHTNFIRDIQNKEDYIMLLEIWSNKLIFQAWKSLLNCIWEKALKRMYHSLFRRIWFLALQFWSLRWLILENVIHLKSCNVIYWPYCFCFLVI